MRALSHSSTFLRFTFLAILCKKGASYSSTCRTVGIQEEYRIHNNLNTRKRLLAKWSGHRGCVALHLHVQTCICLHICKCLISDSCKFTLDIKILASDCFVVAVWLHPPCFLRYLLRNKIWRLHQKSILVLSGHGRTSSENQEDILHCFESAYTAVFCISDSTEATSMLLESILRHTPQCLNQCLYLVGRFPWVKFKGQSHCFRGSRLW